MKHIVTCNALDEVHTTAQKVLSITGNKRILAFYGAMGVGKTTLIKAICKELGVEEVVSSPTFAIINEYYSNKEGAVYHFDFYRVKEPYEALDIGIDEYFYSGNYCFIEWPEKIERFLPGNFVYLKMTEQDSKRLITINLDK